MRNPEFHNESRWLSVPGHNVFSYLPAPFTHPELSRDDGSILLSARPLALSRIMLYIVFLIASLNIINIVSTALLIIAGEDLPAFIYIFALGLPLLAISIHQYTKTTRSLQRLSVNEQSGEAILTEQVLRKSRPVVSHADHLCLRLHQVKLAGAYGGKPFNGFAVTAWFGQRYFVVSCMNTEQEVLNEARSIFGTLMNGDMPLGQSVAGKNVRI